MKRQDAKVLVEYNSKKNMKDQEKNKHLKIRNSFDCLKRVYGCW